MLIKDEATAKEFLALDKTDMPKKEIAAKFGLRPDEISKNRVRWAHLLSNGNGKSKKSKRAKKTKPAAKPASRQTAVAETIFLLKQRREEIDQTIAALERMN